MTIGFVFLYGNGEHEFSFGSCFITLQIKFYEKFLHFNVIILSSGLLIYRIFRYNTKKSLKLAHAFIMVLALFFAILSNLPLTDPPHFYTLHAWIGYAAYALFIFQVIWQCFFFDYSNNR